MNRARLIGISLLILVLVLAGIGAFLYRGFLPTQITGPITGPTQESGTLKTEQLPAGAHTLRVRGKTSSGAVLGDELNFTVVGVTPLPNLLQPTPLTIP
jgi:hypothetical protein